MNDDERRALRILNGAGALTVSACLLGLLGAGFGHVPALGRQLVPGHGAWAAHQHAAHTVSRSAAHPSAGAHGSAGGQAPGAHNGPSASGSPGMRP
jgi:hypothetical protein